MACSARFPDVSIRIFPFLDYWPAMSSLTEKQQRVLDFIESFMRRQDMPPTRAEIAAGLGFRSVNAAVDHLKSLQRKGYIELMQGSSRGIRLLQSDRQEFDAAMPDVPMNQGLALIGQVAAGNPILAEENIEDFVDVQPSMFSPAADYFLRVRGDSMRDAGILDGDLLAVHRADEAQTGQIVVARLDQDVTVKRFRREGGHVWLLPENPDYTPIEVDLSEQSLAIEGLAVGVIRRSGL